MALITVSERCDAPHSKKPGGVVYLLPDKTAASMQTTIKPALFNSAAMYADTSRVQAFIAWVFTGLILLTGLNFAREVVAALLLKMHELFIQKNIAHLV